jgi:transcriptional regulator with XRE-family HTH domain
MSESDKMSALQCLAGRTLLRWSQKRLAQEAHVGISLIYDLERSRRFISEDARRSVRLALENGGVLFDNGGVKLRKERGK